MATVTETAQELVSLIKERHAIGNTVRRDVATHALMLVKNGWPAKDALDESERTLNEAEEEGAY